MKSLLIFNWLFFIFNAVQFKIVGEEGGGSAGQAGEGGTSGEGGQAGSEGTQNSGGGEGGNPPSSEGNAGSGEGGGVDLSSLPDDVQKYIKDLRGESAKYRTQLRNVEDRFGKIENGLKQIFGGDDEGQVSPEERIGSLTQQTEALSMQNAVLSIALEQGLNGDQAEYMQFLLSKAGSELGENEEITDEVFDDILKKVKTSAGSQQASGDTSFQNGGNPPQSGGEEVTLEQFNNMGYMERVNLRKKNEPLYNKLFKASFNN